MTQTPPSERMDRFVGNLVDEVERLWVVEAAYENLKKINEEGRLRYAETLAKKDKEIEEAKYSVDHVGLLNARLDGYIQGVQDYSPIVNRLLRAATNDHTHSQDHDHEGM